MIICICGNVSAREILDANCKSLKELQEKLPVALNCKACHNIIVGLIEEGENHEYLRQRSQDSEDHSMSHCDSAADDSTDE